MICFIDTSAFIAVLDKDDDHHTKAKPIWRNLLEQRAELVSTNYVLLETQAIIQHRIGIKAVRVFNDDIYPVLSVEWVDKALHERAVASVATAGRKKLSLVDCLSFDVMRQRGLRLVFSFDKHFKEQGFELA